MKLPELKKPQLTRRAFIAGGVGAVAVASAAAFGAASCSRGDEDVPAEPAASAEEAQAQKLGGKLTMYACCDEALINAFVPAFMQETGVVVDVVQKNAAECRDDVAAEVAAGRPVADVVWGGDASWYAAGADCFEQCFSSANASVRDDCRNADGYVTPVSREASVIVVNKDRAQRLAVEVEGYESLVGEELTGLVAVADPTKDAAAKSAHDAVRAAGDLLPAYVKTTEDGTVAPGGEEFLSAVWAQVAGDVRASSEDVVQDVLDGVVVAGLVSEATAWAIADQTGELEVVYPKEGCLVALGCTAVAKGADNLEQAQAWVDFVCGESAQRAACDKVRIRSIYDGVGPEDDFAALVVISDAGAGADAGASDGAADAGADA